MLAYVGLGIAAAVLALTKAKTGQWNPLELGKPSTNGQTPSLSSGPIPPPATTSAGDTVVFAPPVSTLPPLPPGQMPAIPFPNAPASAFDIPGLTQLAQQVINYYENANDPTGPIVRGDLIIVNLSKAGTPIPSNLPIVGRVYMEVVDLKVPGDSLPPKKLLAKFLAPELAVLGPQAINRVACQKATRNSSATQDIPMFTEDETSIDLDLDSPLRL